MRIKNSSKLIVIILIFVLIILLPFILLFGCIGYGYVFCPAPPQSTLNFNLDGQNYYWTSSGFESSCISFDETKKTKYDSLTVVYMIPKNHVVLGEGEFDENEITIDFYKKEKDGTIPKHGKIIGFDSVFDINNKNTKIILKINRWSGKPRGKIDGNIKAVLFDFLGKEHYFNGSFNAYQSNGTINSFH